MKKQYPVIVSEKPPLSTSLNPSISSEELREKNKLGKCAEVGESRN